MKKEITNIFIKSSDAERNENNNLLYSVKFDVPPIVIKNKANLKIDGIMSDNNKYLANDGGMPTLIATNFNNTRNYTEENDIPLIKQTINSIKLIVSNDLNNPFAGVPNTFNFCMSLKIEEEINE